MRIAPILLILINLNSFGQKISYPKNYFRHPVDGKLSIAGTFGELRSYHFHTGLDIKANEGTPIRAVADGYLFRIKISESGYGKVMYVNHPNGYTSVYAHLSRFTDTLEKFMYRQQYLAESEEQDLSFTDSAFVFKKGDIIAYSGNTGHSAGPHLHFEIRDTKTEEALNPLLFGIKVKDDVKPTFQGIKVYPLTPTANVEGKNEGKFYSLKTKSGYTKQLTIKANGDIGFAFQVHDYTTESANRCGIYEIQLYDSKNKKIFGQRIERIGFEVSRFINTYKDFDEFHKNNRHVHKSFLKGNNKLKVYTEEKKDGIIPITGKDTLHFYVKAFDVAGNKDSVHIQVIPNQITLKEPPKKDCKLPLNWANDFNFKRDGLEVNIPAGSLYNDACFHYYQKPRTEKSYSVMHAFYTNGEPVQENFDVLIKPDTLIDSALIPKIFIGRTTDFKSITYYKTDTTHGYFAAQARSFGTFCLVADTVGPKIKPIGFKDSMVVSKTTIKEIAFEAKDELSGLQSCKLFVNDKWVLTHFNLKKEKMILLVKEIKLEPGLYPIRVEAMDLIKNTTVFKGFIHWQ